MVSSTPRPHFTPGKNPVPILQEAGWAPGPVWTGGKSRPHRDSIPDPPARSQSLYRLSYPAHLQKCKALKFQDNQYVKVQGYQPYSLATFTPPHLHLQEILITARHQAKFLNSKEIKSDMNLRQVFVP